MSHPWERVDLLGYEAHMADKGVMQLQMLSRITKKQLDLYAGERVGILGIAGGNGLEHMDRKVVRKVYGLDVNKAYLDACAARHAWLGERLTLVHTDLRAPGAVLPATDLLLCNIVLEYLGISCFEALIERSRDHLSVVSCVIQVNGQASFVSRSKHQSIFDPIEAVHREIHREELLGAMENLGFQSIAEEAYPLPNGKTFLRLDFRKGA